MSIEEKQIIDCGLVDEISDFLKQIKTEYKLSVYDENCADEFINKLEWLDWLTNVLDRPEK